MKYWKAGIYSAAVSYFAYLPCLYGNPLLLEPVVQGINTGALVHAAQRDDIYFLDMQDMAEALRFKFNPDTDSGTFLDRSFSLTSDDFSPQYFLEYEGKDFYSLSLYEKLFPIELKVNPLEMTLDVQSEETLPTARAAQNFARRQNMVYSSKGDSFSNYEFDERYFSFPVMDFIYKNTQNFNHMGKDDYTHSYGNYYQANLGMIFGGFDTQVTVFGDDYGNSELWDPGARITISKTLLDEPRNALNLVRFKAGDIVSDGNNLFFNGVNGRGVLFSSFKDLVVSADKTIDITGSMPAGWEAELYLNNQLIGFRQSSIDGRYEFLNIPVNYGLNNFKVVLYGPFGEVREEERRYYSGTSPVSAGELGYNISAQQPNRFIFEGKDDFLSSSDKISANSMFYYGITDYLSLNGGFATAENIYDIGADYQFSTLGAQLALNGVSLQYNMNYNLNKNAVGHHFDLQGDIYIGTIFTRYEYYGDISSPISYYQGGYLKDLFETRLTGSVPFLNVPYYISYTGASGHNGDTYQLVQARLSPNFMRYYNFTIENNWTRNAGFTQNYIDVLLQANYNRFRINGQARYQTNPYSYLNSYGSFLEYRWDKNTYVQATWNHDCKSNYSDNQDIDVFGIGIGRLFKIGGITFNVSADTDRNISFGLTYNISLGKKPNSMEFFTNSENQMMNYGTVVAHAEDEKGNPVKGVKVIVNGRESPSVTDEDGDVIITNLDPHQKAVLSVDGNEVDDLALVPEWTDKKLVLRPGALRQIDIKFNHLGGIEGQLENILPDERYTIYIKTGKGETVATKTADKDGAFIIDGIKHGSYMIEVFNKEDELVGKSSIDITKSFHSIDETIKLKTEFMSDEQN